MTVTQSAVAVLADILPGHEAALRQLLEHAVLAPHPRVARRPLAEEALRKRVEALVRPPDGQPEPAARPRAKVRGSPAGAR